MKPIIPMEPVSSEQIPSGDKWIAQVKWDGVRVLTYYDGNRVQLYNRKQNERTYHYPELTELQTYCKANSVILDGEIIALGPRGIPSFHQVMRRDGIRRLEKVALVQHEVPIAYMVFDCLYVNGEWIIQQPLGSRMEILEGIIIPSQQVQIVSGYKNGQGLYEVVKQHDMEGIVLKDITSPYVIGGKDRSWQKKKYYRDLIAVAGGVTLRDGVVNALLLGLYDEKRQLWYIGHVGTGKLTREEWRQLTLLCQPLLVTERPFINKPDRIKEALWLKPQITVKINYTEWSEGHSVRQPSIQAIVDASPFECTLSQRQL